MKIGFVSLGCSKNLVDTQNALSFLKASGHQFVGNPADAEAIIINTCGFINSAKQEAIDTILEMADYKRKKCKYLIVMGCLVQRYRSDLEREIPEVDLWISIDQYRSMEDIFNEFFGTKTIYPKETLIATAPYTAYLRVADGCDNRCAFCAIPLIRKDYKSVPFEEVIENAKALESIGVKEINVIAQDSTRYGKDLYGRFRLHELLEELNKMNFRWIRILYLYPDEIYDELLTTMAKLKKVVPYFDIPTQHASDRLLKLMNRRGLQKDIVETIEKIKANFPEAILRTTVIVGFPTETEEDFQDLCDFVQKTKWDRLGAFIYSPEEGTKAYEMEPKIDENVSKDRLDRLMRMQAEISLNNNQRYVGQIIDVLVEGSDGIGKKYYGRGEMQAPDDIDGRVIFTSNKEIEEGSFVKVQITEAKQYDLFGRAID